MDFLVLLQHSPAALMVTCAVAGLCVGSFLNVVIHRLPRGESLAFPGSRCPHCGTPIVKAATVLERAASDDLTKGIIQNLVKAEQENTRLVGVVNYLKEENMRLQSENSELRKRTGAETPSPATATSTAQPKTETTAQPATGGTA